MLSNQILSKILANFILKYLIILMFFKNKIVIHSFQYMQVAHV